VTTTNLNFALLLHFTRFINIYIITNICDNYPISLIKNDVELTIQIVYLVLFTHFAYSHPQILTINPEKITIKGGSTGLK